MTAKYHFIPSVRQGIAGEIGKTDTLGAGVEGAAQTSVYVRVNDREDAKKVKVRVHGPGDVTGINRLAIIRTDPAPWSRDFEPNYFPIVDLDDSNFPWRFMPAQADAQGRLRPWLCLVVVRKQEGVSLSYPAGPRLPVLAIKAPAKPSVELPDLAESWAWAHAQVTGNDQQTVANLLANKPAQNLSRLICPRKLEPQQDYLAALVPAFDAGRKTGLGFSLQAADEIELKPAWLSGAAAPAEIDLPVYYHWEFRTADGVDFMSLIRKLEYRPLPEQVGSRAMAVRNLPFGLPDIGMLQLEGALRPVKTRLPANIAEPGYLAEIPAALQGDLDSGAITETLSAALHNCAVDMPEQAAIMVKTPGLQWLIRGFGKVYYLANTPEKIKVYEIPPDFTEKLRDLLNIPAIQSSGADQDPVVGPPIYGSLQSAQSTLPTIGLPSWLNQINLDPRLRVAAGMGTLVVQDQQEALMESAWAQLNDRQTNQSLNQLQLGREASKVILNKHLNAGSSESERMNSLLKKAAPAFRKIQSTGAPSQAAAGRNPETPNPFHQIQQTAFPKGAFSPAFRRIARGGGPVAKRLGAKKETGSFLGLAQLAKPPGLLFAVKRQGHLSLAELKDLLPPPSQNKATKRYRESALSYFNFLENLEKRTSQATVAPPLLEKDLSEISKNLLLQIQPDHSFAERARALKTGEQVDGSAIFRAAVAPEADVTGDPLAPVLTAPQFDYPMYRFLQNISQDFLWSGVKDMPDNSVTLLETNPEFVASFMVGLNHEMSRELLWRDYPVNRQATYFQQFWDCLDKTKFGKQINPIRDWEPEEPLGNHLQTGGLGEQLVILIRGDLLRRFPSAMILAAQTVNGQFQKDKELQPQFQGRLDPDLYFFGFPLREEDVRTQEGWHFIIQQQPTQPRFGLEVAKAEHFGRIPLLKSEMSWGHLVSDAGELDRLSYVSLSGRMKDQVLDDKWKWGYNSGHMALLTLRKPVRIAIPANMILPAQNQQ